MGYLRYMMIEFEGYAQQKRVRLMIAIYRL